MLTIDDLAVINTALARGQDVSIQNTPNGGYRITGNTVKVLKKALPRVNLDSKI